jgi:methylenetetrahydrofolate reductase (NADPH)
MALLPFKTRPKARSPEATAAFLSGFSIEVMPRTAAKVADFREILPGGTRVYLAHIDGTPIEDMVATAGRLAGEGFEVMPHFPARIIHDKAMLADWIARYQGEAGVRSALLLAGGVSAPRGAFHSSMQLMETGLFDRAGFTRLHVAGHPEGNRDIDPDGGDRAVMEALQWKQAFSERTDADMAIVTQFAFEAEPIVAWADRLAAGDQVRRRRLPRLVGIGGEIGDQRLDLTLALRWVQRHAAQDGHNATVPRRPKPPERDRRVVDLIRPPPRLARLVVGLAPARQLQRPPAPIAIAPRRWRIRAENRHRTPAVGLGQHHHPMHAVASELLEGDELLV